MSGNALLAPVPETHIQAALEVLKSRPFVCFGSDSYEVFATLEVGTKVYLYASHSIQAAQVVGFEAEYLGTVNTVAEMKKFEREGYRPATTVGEKWGFYWKVRSLAPLTKHILLSNIQLPSGKYLQGVPHGPLQVSN